jgi:hypothetical protein
MQGLSDTPAITGVTSAFEAPDPQQRAIEDWQAVNKLDQQRRSQAIAFTDDSVALVCMGDLHIGGEGVDYPRLLADCDLIAQTPGMWAVLTGDLIDNFVKPKLLGLRMGTRMTIPDEVEMLRQMLAKIGPKIVAVVAGNHEMWTQQMVGIDYLREVMAAINPTALYDAYDCRFQARLPCGKEWQVRVRHRWRGESIYNATHGIERGRLFDGGFDIGIGAHTHIGGLVRAFNAEGQTCMAVLCGTYKAHDPYARQLGVRATTLDAAVSVVMSRHLRGLVGITDLADAARVLKDLRGQG